MGAILAFAVMAGTRAVWRRFWEISKQPQPGSRARRTIIFGAGVPLVDGMRTVGASTGNRVYQNATSQVKTDIATGRSLESSMASTKVFPNMMLQMVASGEESGELEIMLDKVADFYEREVDDAVAALSSIIEPLLIVILGIIIGTMVLAMYMPIFKMASVF